ncbi:hypothetical protein HGRIS_008411 [Hohenbuehelia grisea]|uniref:F-box domain-containing protein n=1 Tax=Hohenbuehelia grisea TaxID=104357 RepID=A0ABR3J7V5_9AGAR
MAMNISRDIDNEDQLFQFDPYDPANSGAQQPEAEPLISAAYDDDEGIAVHCSLSVEKGKWPASLPMPIRPATTVVHDVFDALSPASASSSQTPPAGAASSSLSPSTFGSHADIYSSPASMSPQFLESLDLVTHAPSAQLDDVHDDSGLGKGKGKGKEQAPTLPPLTFSPTELIYSQTEWPSSNFPSSPGPSSYGSRMEPPAPVASPVSNDIQALHLDARPPSPALPRLPTRSRSLSNLSIHSTRSVRSLNQVKLRLGASKGASSLARKLLFRKREGSGSTPSTPRTETPREAQIIDSPDIHATQGGCFAPWCGELKATPDEPIITTLNNIDFALNSEQPNLALYNSNHAFLKHKGRSNSSPLPLSAFDSFLPSTTDIFIPIPLVTRNYFDECLPKELKLHIFRLLIAMHEEDHARGVADKTWTFARAASSKGRWVGREKGVRDLIKFSRVSKSWQQLVFDGQLWANLDLHAFPQLPAALVKRVADLGGRFVKSVDLSGHAHLLSSTLLDVADSICLRHPSPECTQLTTINLQGCTSLTTRSLHHLLIRSPLLETLNVRGLTAVTNTTFDILSVYCRKLIYLNAGRCANMDADGVRALAANTLARGDLLRLKDLRLSGLKNITDGMMASLGKASPYLEVLDLSYARQLHNSAVEAFVACDDSDSDESLGVQTLVLSAREAGRDANDSGRYRRRVTALRHLCLSSCLLLTDIACANLAHAVPKLEFLELAGIGAELRDEGLVHLLDTTPHIRRLDLEDAADITDAVLAALTPTALADDRAGGAPGLGTPSAAREPGHALEHLVISQASEITDSALLALIRACTRLRVLEADNTRMGAGVLKEFVRTARRRATPDARIVAIDCRAVGENAVRALADMTRPRLGWRAHAARKLKYVDARDDVAEDLKVGQDECDEARVVVKSFYSWQTVDSVKAAREKRRKRNARRAGNESGGMVSEEEEGGGSGRPMRWWSPGGSRRLTLSGTNSPELTPELTGGAGDGCRLM